jgi:hypothetical protein
MVVPRTNLFWWMAASALLMAVGALGPWAKVLGLSVSGIDGDGWFVLIPALLVGVMLGLRDRDRVSQWLVVTAALMGLVGFIVTTVDGAEIVGGGGEDGGELFGQEVVGAGWGLVVAWLASASLIVAALIAFRAKRSGDKGADAAPNATSEEAEGTRSQSTNRERL